MLKCDQWDLLQICCILSEHLSLRTLLDAGSEHNVNVHGVVEMYSLILWQYVQGF